MSPHGEIRVPINEVEHTFLPVHADCCWEVARATTQSSHTAPKLCDDTTL
jgi:hypothetical protein